MHPMTPSRSVDVRPGDVPVHLTRFVGRDAEAAEVRSLLGRERLVTVAGPGGCGKTRLAAHVAAAHPERWPDGVWWVELQAVTDPAAVAARVANAVGALVEPAAGPLRSVASHLREARALLCLDNCEHVLDGVAELVEALLGSCPGVTVLTTSRVPLNVAAETTWRLPAMRDDDALDLFVERARQVRPSFTVDGANRPVLRALCDRLDGMPLAIELAAAWVRSLSPQQIKDAVDDRFSLLVRGPRGAAARHRTLEASIEWSHDLLAARERTLLRRLAAFAGRFGLDEARAVCGGGGLPPADVLLALDALVDASLVVVVEERSDESRFRLLETVRQYAWRQLDAAGELPAVRDRHLDHLLAFAERVEPLLDQDKDAWRAVMEPKRDDLRAALDWGLSADDPERGRRLAAATASLWNVEGHGPEGLSVLRRAMERAPDARTRLQARLMLGLALVCETVAAGDLQPGREGQALAAELGDDRMRSRFLALAAVGAFIDDNDPDTAWRLSDEALRLADATGDADGRDTALPVQGLVLLRRDQHAAAAALLDPVTERLIARGERGLVSTVLVHRSSAALDTGDVEAAWRLAEQAADIARPLADFRRVGTTRCQLALLRGTTGDLDGGLHLLHGFLHGRYADPEHHAVDEAGHQVVVPGMARTLGLLHLWRGDLQDGEWWLAPIAHPVSATPDPSHPHHPPDPLAMAPLAEVLRRQGRATEAAAVLDHAEDLARRLDMPRVLADVVDQRAHLAAPEDAARAFDLHHEALQIRVDHGLRTGQVASLEALAALMVRTDRAVTAARIASAAASARQAIGIPLPPVHDAEHAATLADLRAALPDDELAAATEEGSRLPLADAVTLVRRTRGRRDRPATGWASLTPTEMDVVRLVVDGLANPEIAAKLFISRSTVKTHLGHVFAKLAVANRTELAALATQRLAAEPPPP